ncbi:hypothetical protein CRG98_041415 [Punica granatum]|uniref:Late embryogenesis abundant protein LEA-2 subgroup domain-containing protein n=1 Tax=Punica granatum TaxID=22663 RepID=A0A2I0I2H5_PUNGR|nr:hypothetical protein CRG98_041415 [Punica granatum]
MSDHIDSDRIEQVSRPGNICFCKFLVWLIVSFPSLAFIVFLVIPATMPPQFDIGESSAMSFHISSSLVVTSWNISLLGRNPASLFRVKYSHVTVSLSIDSAPLCPSSVVPGFTQATRRTDDNVSEAAHKWMVQLGGLESCDISFFDVI